MEVQVISAHVKVDGIDHLVIPMPGKRLLFEPPLSNNDNKSWVIDTVVDALVDVCTWEGHEYDEDSEFCHFCGLPKASLSSQG